LSTVSSVTAGAAADPESATPREAVGGRFGGRGVLLGVCCVAQFMVILDLSIVNVALPSIQVSLRFSSADLQWVVDAYAIVFAGFLMLAGRGADIFGQRRVFTLALVVFGLASLAGGTAPTSGVLILARGVQGLGGALMAASSLAIITSSFEGHDRHRAIALWGAMNGAGGAAGTLFGGIITQEASWRWVLLINAPIAVGAVIVARAVVTERRSDKRRSIDLAGALLLTTGLLIEAYGGVTAGNDGWGSAAALVPIVLGSVLLSFFPVIERRAKAPLVPQDALTRPLKVINTIVLLFSSALFPMWFIGSLYLQQVLALSPLDTGLVFLPMALTIFACASQAGKLVSRAGVRPVLGGGLLMMTAGMALFGRIQPSGSPIQYVMLPGILTAMGIGFSIVPSTIAATQGARPGEAGLASGLVNTSRQVGGGLGLAILISIATQYTSHLVGQQHEILSALTDGFRIGYLIGAGLVAAAALVTFLLVPRTQPAARPGFGRWVVSGALTVVACFAAIEFGVPQTHAAPIGTFTTKGAYTFASAPGLHPPKVQLYRGPGAKRQQLPGYVLMANFYDLTKHPMVGQSGPLILDSQMQPVWFQPVPTDVVASNLDAQTYDGQPVLTWWQGVVTPTGLISSGEDVVVNQHYQRVATLKATGGWVLTLHTFLIHGNDAWVTANRNVPADLSRYGGVNNGTLVQSAVQEYDLRTGKLLYSWNATGHIPLTDSYTQPPPNGFPWDAYHVNSISVGGDGTFVVSMRNTSAAYKVNIATGRVLWVLGGKRSSFKIPATDSFSWQHDVEVHGSSTITMFDDDCCEITGAGQYLAPAGPSRALELKLDPATHTVTQIAQYSHGLTFDAEYMGNTQLLSDGDVFVGWGQVPYMSLYTKSGRLLLDGVLPTPDMSYRAYVRHWVGEPLTRPTGAARRAGGETTVYASWNGATKVVAWRVLALAASTATRKLAQQRRTGFETAIRVGSAAGRFEVEALDAGGKVIGTSRSFGLNG
jgi:EmrB/QacA subfamily drug resistance transporter